MPTHHPSASGRVLQNLFLPEVTVKKDRALRARAFAWCFTFFPHLVARPPRELKSRTGHVFLTVEDIPAWSLNHKILQTGQGETSFVDQFGDLTDLGNIKC